LSGTGPLQIVIRATNAGAAQLLLDDIFFAPLVGAAEANVYHETFLDLAATVGFNSATTRSLLDSRRRPATDVGAAGSVTNVVMPCATQLFHEVPDGDPFIYPKSDPDSVLALTPTEPSPFANFNQGDAWKSDWTFNAAAWGVVNGTLVHTASSADTITWNPTNGWSDYGARVSIVLPIDADGRPILPRRPLGIRVGSRFEAKWERAGQWTITLDGKAVSVTTGTSAFQNDWLVAAPTDPVSNVTSLIVYAGGRLLFARNLDAPLSGAFAIFVEDAKIGFHGIAAMRAPRINLTFTDGSGKQRQRHAWSGAGDYVTGTFYDPVGRPAVPLKTILVTEDQFSYLPDLVTSFDSATGVMRGRVADFYPADEGYPYARTDYYRSPLAMTSAQSLPGRELAITLDNPHVRRFIYGTNAPPFWDAQWPSGEYFVQRTIDPDGGNTFTLRTKTDQVVAVKAGPMSDGTYRTSVMEYDNAGRAVREYLPNHFGASAPPDSFVAETDYNFLGEVLELRDPDGGTTRAANDRSGQKRFSMTNAGGQTGTIVYAKYDALGRTLEQGFFEGTWNQSFLNDKASDPKWPDDTQPHTWTLRNEYDGDGSDPAEIGRLRRATTRGDGEVIQTFTYNIAGAVTGIEQTAPSFDSTPRAVGYTYNVAGDNVGLTYPAGSAVAEVRHSYDRTGNLFRLGTPQSPSEFGAYEYNAAGAVQRATLDPQSARPLVRTHDYNPPGWPLSIRTTIDTATLLSESLTYTSGGYNGAAYYSGQAASITFDGSATTAYAYRNNYDRLRQLTVAQNTADANASLGVPSPLTYDADGNFDQYLEGAQTRRYEYERGTDRVARVTSGDTTLDSYTYTEQGNVHSAQRLQLEDFTYQPTTGLPSSIRTADGRTLAFSYDQNGQRVLKTLRDNGEVAAKLYVRGTSLMPLAESSRGTNQGHSQYVYGPGGLQGLLTGGRRYTVVRDHLGSVRAVVDEERNLVASFEYLPFGTLIRRGGSTPDLLYYRFTGQELDPETGLYAFAARMYEPWLGRFYAVDPAGAGFSPYPYADNDPLNLVDPTGEEPLTVFLILLAIGIVVGAVAGLVTYATTYEGDFDGLKFVLYGIVGAVAGGIGAAAGFVAGQLTVAALAAAGVATSTSIGSGIVVGAATAAVEGAVSGGLNQIGQNVIEKREWNEGLGSAIGMGATIGAVTGAVLGGATGALNRRVALRLAQGDIGAHATANGNLYNNTWLNVANNQGNDFVGAVQNTGANEVLSLAGHGGSVGRNITNDLGNVVINSTQIVNAAPVGGFQGYGVNLTAVCHAGRNGIAREIASGFNVPVRAANSVTWTRGAGAALAGRTRAIPTAWSNGLLAKTGRFETIYPSRLKTGWVGIFGY
jgi:RHS repeat-associated protein